MWRALWKALLSFISDWLERKERDALVAEETQDDIRIADQAAAIRVLRDAASVPSEPPADDGGKPLRRGRRPSAKGNGEGAL